MKELLRTDFNNLRAAKGVQYLRGGMPESLKEFIAAHAAPQCTEGPALMYSFTRFTKPVNLVNRPFSSASPSLKANNS